MRLYGENKLGKRGVLVAGEGVHGKRAATCREERSGWTSRWRWRWRGGVSCSGREMEWYEEVDSRQ
eukprot:3577334-Pleurochrysis_carterae.AAC.1